MKINEIIEAVVVPRQHSKVDPDPVLDTDTIRVYHGADNVETVILALTKGLTGDMKIYRRYSYENDNNPRGLFVTPDLKTAKEFGDYILEFHAKGSELEAPVWPGGSYTVQGQQAQYFGSDEARNQARLNARAAAKSHESDYVKSSSKPELAQTFLTGGERQALFTGSLDPNSVRAVWVRSNMQNVASPFVRMSPREFLKQYRTTGIKTRHNSLAKPSDKKSDFFDQMSEKLVKPRDNVTAEQLVALVAKRYPRLDKDEIIDILKNNPDYVDRFLWSDTQKNTVKQQLRSIN